MKCCWAVEDVKCKILAVVLDGDFYILTDVMLLGNMKWVKMITETVFLNIRPLLAMKADYIIQTRLLWKIKMQDQDSQNKSYSRAAADYEVATWRRWCFAP